MGAVPVGAGVAVVTTGSENTIHLGSRVNRMVLVTGAGRSGTSTVAGTLHHLGLHVPLPVLKPNASNPQGFFEPVWPVRFHNRLMNQALISLTDARPEAYALVAEAVTEEEHDALRTWMSGLFDEGPTGGRQGPTVAVGPLAVGAGR